MKRTPREIMVGDENVSQQLIIDQTRIEEELSRSASLYAWWAVQEVKAKDALDAYEGQAARKLRDGPDRMSETRIASELKTDGDYLRHKRRYHTMQVIANAFELRAYAVRAMSKRQENLMSLEARKVYADSIVKGGDNAG